MIKIIKGIVVRGTGTPKKTVRENGVNVDGNKVEGRKQEVVKGAFNPVIEVLKNKLTGAGEESCARVEKKQDDVEQNYAVLKANSYHVFKKPVVTIHSLMAKIESSFEDLTEKEKKELTLSIMHEQEKFDHAPETTKPKAKDIAEKTQEQYTALSYFSDQQELNKAYLGLKPGSKGLQAERMLERLNEIIDNYVIHRTTVHNQDPVSTKCDEQVQAATKDDKETGGVHAISQENSEKSEPSLILQLRLAGAKHFSLNFEGKVDQCKIEMKKAEKILKRMESESTGKAMLAQAKEIVTNMRDRT